MATEFHPTTVQLLQEAGRTEDAITIYNARLALVTLLHAAPQGSLPLDADTLVTVLRRLFRTVKPDLSSATCREKMRAVLNTQLLGDDRAQVPASSVAAATSASARRVQGLARHCRGLLDSMARASAEKGAARFTFVCYFIICLSAGRGGDKGLDY
jgi:hypothetical protein